MTRPNLQQTVCGECKQRFDISEVPLVVQRDIGVLFHESCVKDNINTHFEPLLLEHIAEHIDLIDLYEAKYTDREAAVIVALMPNERAKEAEEVKFLCTRLFAHLRADFYWFDPSPLAYFAAPEEEEPESEETPSVPGQALEPPPNSFNWTPWTNTEEERRIILETQPDVTGISLDFDRKEGPVMILYVVCDFCRPKNSPPFPTHIGSYPVFVRGGVIFWETCDISSRAWIGQRLLSKCRKLFGSGESTSTLGGIVKVRTERLFAFTCAHGAKDSDTFYKAEQPVDPIIPYPGVTSMQEETKHFTPVKTKAVNETLPKHLQRKEVLKYDSDKPFGTCCWSYRGNLDQNLEKCPIEFKTDVANRAYVDHPIFPDQFVGIDARALEITNPKNFTAYSSHPVTNEVAEVPAPSSRVFYVGSNHSHVEGRVGRIDVSVHREGDKFIISRSCTNREKNKMVDFSASKPDKDGKGMILFNQFAIFPDTVVPSYLETWFRGDSGSWVYTKDHPRPFSMVCSVGRTSDVIVACPLVTVFEKFCSDMKFSLDSLAVLPSVTANPVEMYGN